MKALVTGGAGFIGSWVVDALIEKGLETVVVDDLSSGRKENLQESVRLYEVDIRDKKIGEIFENEKPDYVFHLAAQINLRKSIEDPQMDSEINIVGSVNLLNQSVKHNVKKFIFSSTGGAIYDEESEVPTSERGVARPKSPYGIAKLSVENYIRYFGEIHGLDSAVLRYSNVYGPRQDSLGEAGVVSIFLNNILDGKESVVFGDGTQTRDFVYVKDVANANILGMDLSGIYNVGTGKERSVNDIFEKIGEVSGIKGEKIYGEAILGELKRSALDCSKIRSEGWEPKYGLESGLRETVEYFREKNKA